MLTGIQQEMSYREVGFVSSAFDTKAFASELEEIFFLDVFLSFSTFALAIFLSAPLVIFG